MELLTQRTQVLGKWLSNPLFLVTLEDYDGTIIAARCAPWRLHRRQHLHQQLPRVGGDAQLGADGEAQLFQP